MPCPNPQTPRSRHSAKRFASFVLYRWPPAGAFSYGFLALLLLVSRLSYHRRLAAAFAVPFVAPPFGRQVPRFFFLSPYFEI